MSDIAKLPGATKEYQVISNDILLDALREADDQVEWTPEAFPTVRTLSLSYKMLCFISNLGGFTALTRLNLSNNAIEKISGLDNLVNLESLDLSFNRLTSIENIGHLHRLTDLLLNNNHLTDIEGLRQLNTVTRVLTGVPEQYHGLQVLNLSNNSLSNVTQTILLLREFRDLRVLSTEKNPLAQQAGYRTQAIAFLPSLRYLDNRVIMEQERKASHESFKMDLVSFEERDTVETQARQKALAKARQIRIDCAADALGLATFTDREFLDTEVTNRICLIPAVRTECHGRFRALTSAIFRDLARLLRRRRILTVGELAEFEEAYDIITEQGLSNLDRAIRAYKFRRDDLMDLYDLRTSKNPKNSVHYATETRAGVLSLIPELRQELFGIEAETTSDLNDIMDQVIANLTALVGKTIELTQTAFTKVRDQLLQLHESCATLLSRAMDLKAAKEAGLSGGMDGRADLGAETIAEGGDTAQGTGNTMAAGFVNFATLAELQSLLPAELTPEVHALLRDKGSVVSASVAAHESRMSALDQREDALIAAQKEFLEHSTKIINAGESQRSRQHSLDIDLFVRAEEQWVENWFLAQTQATSTK